MTSPPAKRNNLAFGVFVVIGLVVIGYLGFILVSAFSSTPAREAAKPVVRQPEISTAVLTGDVAVRTIAEKWDKASLARALDPSVHHTDWYKNLEDMIPTYQESLGPIVAVVGSATYAPRGDVDYYDYRGKFECEKGSGSMRMLVVKSQVGWIVIGAEITMDLPDLSKTELTPSK